MYHHLRGTWFRHRYLDFLLVQPCCLAVASGSEVGSSASRGFLVAKFLGENRKFNDASEVTHRLFVRNSWRESLQPWHGCVPVCTYDSGKIVLFEFMQALSPTYRVLLQHQGLWMKRNCSLEDPNAQSKVQYICSILFKKPMFHVDQMSLPSLCLCESVANNLTPPEN